MERRRNRSSTRERRSNMEDNSGCSNRIRNRISLNLSVEQSAADNQSGTSGLSRSRTLPAVSNNSESSALRGDNFHTHRGNNSSISSYIRTIVSSVRRRLRRVTIRRNNSNSESTVQPELAVSSASSNTQPRTNRRRDQANQQLPQAANSDALPGNRSNSSTAQQNPQNQQVTVQRGPRVHTTVDFVHCMVPALSEIFNCGYYWGIMDRYEAESLLENKAEGTFLLRDSSQNEFLFSVSFRRYGRSLHARIEQWDHFFSFDIHDSNIYKAANIHTLLEHYKDPQMCMFFEPMLTKPLNRPHVFSLQQLSRGVICDHITYDDVDSLPVSRQLQEYLKLYHYKQRVRIRTYSGSDDGDYQSIPA